MQARQHRKAQRAREVKSLAGTTKDTKEHKGHFYFDVSFVSFVVNHFFNWQQPKDDNP
jgi:hypothetical protein